MTVHEFNAHRFSDNYAIVVEETDQCVGTEQNKEEADALSRYLTNRSGNAHKVVKNGREEVRAAKEMRKGRGPLRHQLREDAFREIGIWK